jgi:flagellar assembly factor FliW
MEIGTTRFGTINVRSADKLCFPCGIPGFEECRDWVLLVDKPNRAVGWLQSANWPEVALPVASPRQFVGGYEVRIADADLAPLGLDSADDLQILAVLGQTSGDLTLNLKAPLAINTRRRLGRQVVQLDDWSIQHAVLVRSALLRKIA